MRHLVLLLLLCMCVRLSATMVRDGSVEGLVSLLNAHHNDFPKLPKNISEQALYTSKHSEKFLQILGMWLDLPPIVELVHTTPNLLPLHEEVKCGNPLYSRVLTGKQSPLPRVIVDFIPFGYDIDALEIRLSENFDVVDLFVVYENVRTQSGYVKPYIFGNALRGNRFSKFTSKILYLRGEDWEINQYTQQTLKATKRTHDGKKKVKLKKGNSDSWALEKATRSEMMRKFKLALRTNSTLQYVLGLGASGNRYIFHDQDYAEQYPGRPYAIQNDEDELINRNVLLHIKYCEIKPEAPIIYTPSFSFKKSFSWLQRTRDMRCLQSSVFSGNLSFEMSGFLWRPGPYLWPLSEFLEAGTTNRNKRDGKHGECRYHMDYGAAVHLSSLADPAMAWFKRFGVIEDNPKGIFINALIDAIRHEKVNAALIYALAVHPWCNLDNPAAHLSTLSTDAQTVVAQSIPNTVKMNPGRYPFHVPSLVLDSSQNWRVRELSHPDWIKKCTSQSGFSTAL